METVIPSIRNKPYLSGVDWLISALDYAMKATTNAGNMSQIVIMLDTVVDEVSLRGHLRRFTKEIPALYGKISRNITCVPYWRIPEGLENDLNFNVYHVNNEGVLSLLKSTINKPFNSSGEHLAFHLIYEDSRRCYLAMTFDHCLFDARGAETFLDLFQQYLTENNKDEIIKRFSCPPTEVTFQWFKNIRAMKNVKSRMVKPSIMAALPLPNSKAKRGFSFRIIPFDQAETDQIYNRSHDEAGYFMEMPYLLSVVIQTVHALFKIRGMTKDTYLIPVSIDMRNGEDIKQNILFNHLSFLFFQVHFDDVDNQEGLLKSIKQQMYEQVQSGFPEDIRRVSLLTRVAPLPALGKLFRLACKEKLASFCFSYMGKCSYKYADIMGAEINNLFHMPRVPTPPGIGFFFNHFNSRLNLVISYLDGLLQDEEIAMIESGIKQRLGCPAVNEHCL
ncbi:MAG: hypothetical protein HY757_06470 [Nitrospirae bacterium]|nr:hypothetical protein [Nitrospirota bacterium]